MDIAHCHVYRGIPSGGDTISRPYEFLCCATTTGEQASTDCSRRDEEPSWSNGVCFPIARFVPLTTIIIQK